MDNFADIFLQLFEGYGKAHGQTAVLDRAKHGKTQANYKIVHEPLTVELVQNHLDGKLGVGSIPIDERSQCSFGALDIDDYNLDLTALLAKVKRFKLPLIMCRSKSGGAHLFLFLSEKPRKFAIDWLNSLPFLAGGTARYSLNRKRFAQTVEM